jgi:hypothetical protein
MEVRSIRAAGAIFQFVFTIHNIHAHVAQLDEYEITNLGDAGSSPAVSSIFNAASGRAIGPCATARPKAQTPFTAVAPAIERVA